MNNLGKNLRNKLNILNKKVMGEEGSTLLLIMFTIVILSMLGFALMSMLLSSFSMKKSDLDISKAKYYSESGIEQVYARVADIIRLGINYSKEKTDDYMEDEMNKINEIFLFSDCSNTSLTHVMISDPSQHPDYIEYKENKGYFDENLVIDTEAIKASAEKEYKRNFRKYINSVILKQDGVTKSLKEILIEQYNALENTSLASISVDDCIPFEEDTDSAIISGIESSFAYKDSVKKVISADIFISDAEKSYPFRNVQETINLKDNRIWQNALVVNGDIRVKGTASLIVDGNIYVMGKKASNLSDPKTFGGLIAEDNSTVDIAGSVFSKESIQLGINSSSNILLDKGYIYVNTLVGQEGSVGEIRVLGDVYTKEALRLNGNGSDIHSATSYYGYLDEPSSAANALRAKAVKDYLYYLHNMKERDGDDELASETIYNQTPSIQNANPIEKYTKLDTALNDLAFNSINELPSDVDGTLKNFSTSSDELIIYGAGYEGTSDINHIYLGNKVCDGIIIRKGDVSIYGDVFIRGAIISTGDITVYEGKANILNRYSDISDKRRMSKIIYDDDRLVEIFNVTNYGVDNTIDHIDLDDLSFNFISPSNDDTYVNNNTLDYDKYLSYKHWRVIQ